MRVPQGLEWPLNQLALESVKDDTFQDWAKNHRPSWGVCGCEGPPGPRVASKLVALESVKDDLF